MKNRFQKRTVEVDKKILQFDRLETLQVNVGNLCNQSCAHCHVNAGPDGTNIMKPNVMDGIKIFVHQHSGLTVDITGGCPEMNPFFRPFMQNLAHDVDRIMVRTNLTIFAEPKMQDLPEWYAHLGVVLVASLPCYLEENVDHQRGSGAYMKSIEALKKLNAVGYGVKNSMELNLVYNPGTDCLPAGQQDLEQAYKVELKQRHNIEFNNLFTITNAPIGRFARWLKDKGKLNTYLALLESNFTRQAARQIMCRRLVSVDWQGILYNCDFNQALDRPILDLEGRPATIDKLDELLARGFEILTDNHCFCCTAGAGSSCTGALLNSEKKVDKSS